MKPQTLHRHDCPVCGREVNLPQHRFCTPWTDVELHWARKLHRAGLNLKSIARLLGCGPAALHEALQRPNRGRTKPNGEYQRSGASV